MLRLRILAAGLLVLAACARQGAIPNPDRFPPHLVSATSLNRTRVSLRFDDELDSTALLPSTFLLTSPHDTARIRFVARDEAEPRRNALILLTSPLLDEVYTVSALVVDRHGNAASVRGKFRASTREDTTAPLVLVSPLQPQTSFPYRLALEFSEPVDTGRGVQTLGVPVPAEGLVSGEWNRGLVRYSVTCKDTTLRSRPFYLVLLPSASDFTGNRMRDAAWTFVYSDTALVLRDVRGIVRTADGRAASASLVTFSTDGLPFAAVLTDSSGAFLATIEDRENVAVQAWFSRDRDAMFEEHDSLFWRTLPDSIELHTRVLPAPRPLPIPAIP